MAHIRIFRHYIHTSFLVAAFVEGLAVMAAAYTGHLTRWGSFPDFYAHLPFAITLGVVLTLCMAVMGVHEARLREGFTGVLLRTAVAMFLLGTLVMAVVMYLATGLVAGRGELMFALTQAFLFVSLLRWITSRFISEDILKRRVIVYGTGEYLRI